MTEADVDAAAQNLARHVAWRAQELAVLPEPADRDPEQRRVAARLHQESRLARRRFLGCHAEAVYDALTGGRTRRLRVEELASAAADRFPGLVPSAVEMSVEEGRAQADKEGVELDQGLFFHALLDSPHAGDHLIETMSAATARARAALASFQATGVADLDTVQLRQEGHTAHVTVLNRHCLNAEDNRLIADLEVAVDLVALHDDIRVAVLRGGEVAHPKYPSTRVFSAGINLTDLRAGRISFVRFLLARELGYVSKFLHGVCTDPDELWPRQTAHKPWIAVVDTFAIGGGAQLLLVFDHVIAVRGAYLSLPAAQEGIIPGLANLRLGRFGGGRLARQMILGGQKVDVSNPAADCLVDEVVAAEDVAAAVERAASALSAPAVAANRRMLALAEEPTDVLRCYLAEFALVQAQRLYADDVLAKVDRWQESRSSR